MSKLPNAGLHELLGDAADRAVRYLAGIDDRSVAPGPEQLADLARFAEPLPEGPCPAAETLALLDDAGSPATVASTGGRYFGFVTGGTLPVALASSWLAATWDQNTALPVMSPVAARLQEVVTVWLAKLLGLPAGTSTVFTPGASMANTTALAVARDSQLARAGWDVQADGLAGAPKVTVVLGEGAHSTIFKALGLVGLGRNQVVKVPGDDQGRMRADQLPDLSAGPTIVCAQAGEVNTGAFDNFPAIVDWARARDAWVHVDGAFGLWALADPSRRHLTEGLAGADSWATDGHKWLNVTYDCGITFFREPGEVLRTFASTAGYLPPGGGFEAMHNSPSASQRARQIEVWAVLRTLGRAGIAELVQESCRHARAVADGLQRAGLEVVNDVVLNQVLVRAGSDETTQEMIAAVQAGGTCWCGPTVWQGRPAMRVSVSGWATDDADVEATVAAIVAGAGA